MRLSKKMVLKHFLFLHACMFICFLGMEIKKKHLFYPCLIVFIVAKIKKSFENNDGKKQCEQGARSSQNGTHLQSVLGGDRPNVSKQIDEYPGKYLFVNVGFSSTYTIWPQKNNFSQRDITLFLDLQARPYQFRRPIRRSK